MTPPPLPALESLTVEFKSDRKRLPDADLGEAVVCLANAEELWLGVEDDGTPTDVRQHGTIRRSEVVDLCRLTAPQARDLLKRLKTTGRLMQQGERRGAHYTLAERGGRIWTDMDGLWTCPAGLNPDRSTT